MALGDLLVRHANVEQSNSSVIFGEALILKALRRLVTGVHPEIEIARFLGERTTFDRAPAMLGWAEVPEAQTERPRPSRCLQRFVPNQGDGWTYLLRKLSRTRRSCVRWGHARGRAGDTRAHAWRAAPGARVGL